MSYTGTKTDFNNIYIHILLTLQSTNHPTPEFYTPN